MIGRFIRQFAGTAGRAEEPALRPDPTIAYPAGQDLARQLRGEVGGNGVIYPSARHAGGTCLVAFRPDLVLNLRHGRVWRLAWRDSPLPSRTRM